MKRSKVALVPWDETIKENSIFRERYEGYEDIHILLKKAFEERGMELNTIDVYTDLMDVDCFLFFSLDYKWLNKVIKYGLQHKAVYCSAEPAVVKPINSKKGYEKLLKIFAYILTWDETLIDNKRIFRRNIPYLFKKNHGNVCYKDRKLLVNVSGNKRSKEPNELYSEREKVISFFERNYPQDFDLYGVGWKKKEHPSYGGIIERKEEIYHHYRFALSLENTYNVEGYITEKIFDCFAAGIVPIYKGASNIGQYVPKECYIDYDRFASLEDLAAYLKEMPEERYNGYLKAIDDLLNTDIQKYFSSDLLCEYICQVMQKIGEMRFQIPFPIKLALAEKEWDHKRKLFFMAMRRNTKKKILELMRR